ncbi:hypothetical protein INR49_007221 [Caranx melampygus]|nr:hypothetical protein INR49_007221 [Caranx melampygus]
MKSQDQASSSSSSTTSSTWTVLSDKQQIQVQLFDSLELPPKAGRHGPVLGADTDLASVYQGRDQDRDRDQHQDQDQDRDQDQDQDHI